LQSFFQKRILIKKHGTDYYSFRALFFFESGYFLVSKFVYLPVLSRPNLYLGQTICLFWASLFTYLKPVYLASPCLPAQRFTKISANLTGLPNYPAIKSENKTECVLISKAFCTKSYCAV
jgi:hypothetical protein